MLPPINTFFSFDHTCHFLSLSGKYIVGKLNLISLESWYSKLFHGAKIFFVFWRYFVLWIFEQKSCFFTISKNIISPVRIKKKFFFENSLHWLFCKKVFGKKCVHWSYNGLNMSVIFKQVNFLNFVKSLKEKCSIFSVWNSVCNSECQNLINENNFWQKLFCKIINATRNFHKKNFFWFELEKLYFLTL